MPLGVTEQDPTRAGQTRTPAHLLDLDERPIDVREREVDVAMPATHPVAHDTTELPGAQRGVERIFEALSQVDPFPEIAAALVLQVREAFAVSREPDR